MSAPGKGSSSQEFMQEVRNKWLREAGEKWYVDKICKDLVSCKTKVALENPNLRISKKHTDRRGYYLLLTDKEEAYLYLLLMRHSPDYIARELCIARSSVNVELSNTVYRYVGELTRKKVEDWRDVSHLLQEQGYRKARMRLTIEIPDDLNIDSLLDLQDFDLQKLNPDSLDVIAVVEKLQEILQKLQGIDSNFDIRKIGK